MSFTWECTLPHQYILQYIIGNIYVSHLPLNNLKQNVYTPSFGSAPLGTLGHEPVSNGNLTKVVIFYITYIGIMLILCYFFIIIIYFGYIELENNYYNLFLSSIEFRR